MKEKVLEILKSVRQDVDFSTATALIDDGIPSTLSPLSRT